MTTLGRWLRFNGVGAMGMVVQLGMLALFERAARGHYLLASAAALEVTLLHNFAWHLRVTWKDRGGGSGTWQRRLLRFHVSNGAVSLAGNLVIMRLLVDGAHVPVLAANLVAIVCCSIANFWLGDQWAFAAAGSTRQEGA